MANKSSNKNQERQRFDASDTAKATRAAGELSANNIDEEEMERRQGENRE